MSRIESPYKHLLVLVSGADVTLHLASVHGGIPQTAVVRLHVYLGSHTALLADGRTGFHLLPQGQVLLHTW